MINEPIYVGFSILDLNKLLIYELHYNRVKRKLKSNLLLTDTDSLIYEIWASDVYKDFYEDKLFFDVSDHPQDSNVFDDVNNKVIAKMKDNFKGNIISEFVGLKKI